MKWYYSTEGRTEGPVGSDVLQRLALSGALQPQDLIWSEDAGRDAAVEAQSALLFPVESAELPAPSAPSAQPSPAGLPDWLSDVRAPEQRGQKPATGAGPLMQGAEGVPDWLQDFLSRPPAPPSEPATENEAGIDHETGRVFDSEKFERWLEEQNVARKTKLATEPIPSLHEHLQKAKFEIEEWADNSANRQLVLSGDLEAVRADAALRAVLRGYDEWGPEMTDKLHRHVAFVVENRRKFHASRPSD
jgi:hypothetical protein